MMRVCFPVEAAIGLESPLCGHFGSAPAFLSVDTGTSEVQVLDNRNSRHAHGMCQPLQAMGTLRPDALVVGGIGAGALMKLSAAGIRVFQGIAGTVAENLQALQEGRLPETGLDSACGHHGGGHGQAGHSCGHGH